MEDASAGGSGDGRRAGKHNTDTADAEEMRRWMESVATQSRRFDSKLDRQAVALKGTKRTLKTAEARTVDTLRASTSWSTPREDAPDPVFADTDVRILFQAAQQKMRGGALATAVRILQAMDQALEEVRGALRELRTVGNRLDGIEKNTNEFQQSVLDELRPRAAQAAGGSAGGGAAGGSGSVSSGHVQVAPEVRDTLDTPFVVAPIAASDDPRKRRRGT